MLWLVFVLVCYALFKQISFPVNTSKQNLVNQWGFLNFEQADARQNNLLSFVLAVINDPKSQYFRHRLCLLQILSDHRQLNVLEKNAGIRCFSDPGFLPI